VPSFAEYAALARHLNDLHRSAERTAARLAAERGDAEATADRLDQRLAAQHHRLAELGQAIGKTVPPPATPISSPPVGVPPSAPVEPAGVAEPTGPGTAGATGPAVAGTPYPELPGGAARRALLPTPSTTAAGAPGTAVAGRVPGPRGPAEPAPPSPRIDPHRELELARQAADGADVMIVQAETMAQRPPLFPNLSPLRRALAVYGSCAGVLAVVIWTILSVVEFRAATSTFSKAAAAFGVFSWSCAGLPTIAFFAGYLVLSIWGKPKLASRRPRRFARLGFLICFLAAPLAFMIYYGFAD